MIFNRRSEAPGRPESGEDRSLLDTAPHRSHRGRTVLATSLLGACAALLPLAPDPPLHAAPLLLATPLLATPVQATAAAAEDEHENDRRLQWASTCDDWDEWDKPAAPFRVHGNSYYVGTCGIGAILIAGETGHVLIDSGTEAGADVVLANIRALGFDPADIVLLAASHEHFDHVGGMAKLQAASGAPLFVGNAAVEVLRTGQVGADDPQASQLGPMTPVAEVSAALPDGVHLIGQGALDQATQQDLAIIALTPLATPGHTPGALSWQWQSCEGPGTCKTIVYGDSLSPVSSEGYRFSDHPGYLAAYREGIDRIAAQTCDILLTPHPSASEMRAKLLAGDLSSGMDCKQYAASIAERLDARLAEEEEAAR